MDTQLGHIFTKWLISLLKPINWCIIEAFSLNLYCYIPQHICWWLASTIIKAWCRMSTHIPCTFVTLLLYSSRSIILSVATNKKSFMHKECQLFLLFQVACWEYEERNPIQSRQKCSRFLLLQRIHRILKTFSTFYSDFIIRKQSCCCIYFFLAIFLGNAYADFKLIFPLALDISLLGKIKKTDIKLNTIPQYGLSTQSKNKTSNQCFWLHILRFSA